MYRKTLSFAFLFFILAAPTCWGVEHQYITAKIAAVQRKTREKVDMYLVNTPVSTEIRYFELIVRLDKTEYTAEYTPRHEEELPAEWVAGADIFVRLEKHSLFLKRSDGSEIRWTIVKRHAIKEEQE